MQMLDTNSTQTPSIFIPNKPRGIPMTGIDLRINNYLTTAIVWGKWDITINQNYLLYYEINHF